MKKAILLFLAALMCVSMLACSVANSGSETTPGLISDMAIGEENESGFYDEYYDLNGSLVQAQINAHGEY